MSESDWIICYFCRKMTLGMKYKVLLATILAFLAIMVQAQPVTITPPEAHIDPGQSVTLTASGALYYTWSPATGLSTTEGPVTVASPTVTTTYTCTGFAPGAESVVNGDFVQGNVGFTSSYQYNTNLWNEGTYYVDSDASLHHENFFGTGHGDGGNFMMVNGSTTPQTNVWTEQISVVPNTYYAFSTWACTLAGLANEVALLQFSINGSQIGEVFSAPPERYIWEQFYELWYSGNATTATITILNQNTVGSGNDFGLDDISFRQLVPVGSPTCTVYVGSMSASATADDTELCEGETTTLHALPSGGSGNYSYSWTPASSLSNPNIQHPVATPPVGTTTYTCHITDNSWGSSQNVSVTIIVHPNEEEHEYETICEGDTYDFYGQTLSAPGTYPHESQTQYGCLKTTYLHLDNWPTYDETTITAYICPGESYTFYGVEYSQTCQQVYTDHTAHGCDSIVRLNLTVYPANDTTLVDATICVGQSYNFHGTLYDQDGQVAYFDTIDNHGCLKVEKLVLTVGEYQTPPVVYQYECYEHGTTPSWTWDKTGITYHEDTTDEIILPDPQGGCDIKHRLDLKFHEEYYHEEYKVACDAYYWPIIGETYTESQDPIVKTFQYEFGDKICDSTYVLHLEISNYETNAFTVSDEDNCDSYLWDPEGKEYSTNDDYDPEDHVYAESGTYERTYQNHQGCDSIVTMTVQFGYTPDPTEIYPKDTSNTAPHWVIPATEFQINSYEFRFWDNNSHCIWESVSWSFENPDVRWLLEPDTISGKSCKMYVLDYEEDTVWLQATAYNRCAPDGVTQRYWFVCSYYGIEDDPSTGIGNFTVTPNPNNGQMTLNFDRMMGRVDVKVYDMTGNLIDHIETVSEGDSTMHYDLKGGADGVYFFVATSKEGTMVKKVIIKP